MAKATKPKFEPIDQAEIERIMAPVRAAAADLAARLDQLGQPTANPRLITREGRVIAWVELSPRERRLAVAEPGGALEFPDMPTFVGRIRARLSPDETRVVVTKGDDKSVWIVGVMGLDPCVAKLVFQAGQRASDADWLDDQRLVVAADKQILVVDATTGAAAAQQPAKSAASLEVLREHGLIALTATDESVQVWKWSGSELGLFADVKRANGVQADGQGVYLVGAPWRRLVAAG